MNGDENMSRQASNPNHQSRGYRLPLLSVALPPTNLAAVPEPAPNTLKGPAQNLSRTGRRNRPDDGLLMEGPRNSTRPSVGTDASIALRVSAGSWWIEAADPLKI